MFIATDLFRKAKLASNVGFRTRAAVIPGGMKVMRSREPVTGSYCKAAAKPRAAF